MPVRYVVQAQVVDLQEDAPRTGDVFFVDTNVWLWTCYAKATLGMTHQRRQQTTGYAGYLNRCARAGAVLHWCGLGLSKLAHNIERTEYEIWKGTGHANEKPKEFRHNYSAERNGVVQEMENAWQAVEALGTVLPAPLVVDHAATTNALAEYKTLAVDGYDLFFLQAARASAVTQIISDDCDFCGVPGITLFTSNRTVLLAAHAQGKMLVRQARLSRSFESAGSFGIGAEIMSDAGDWWPWTEGRVEPSPLHAQLVILDHGIREQVAADFMERRFGYLAVQFEFDEFSDAHARDRFDSVVADGVAHGDSLRIEDVLFRQHDDLGFHGAGA